LSLTLLFCRHFLLSTLFCLALPLLFRYPLLLSLALLSLTPLQILLPPLRNSLLFRLALCLFAPLLRLGGFLPLLLLAFSLGTLITLLLSLPLLHLFIARLRILVYQQRLD
jgi:hypothetical protein